MGAWLVEAAGEHEGRSHLLEAGRRLTLGRAPESDVVVAHARASRRHAEVWNDGERWWIRDLATRNGTVVNGTRLTDAHELLEGDEIVLPGLRLAFHATDETLVAAAPAAGHEPTATKTFLFADLRGYTAYIEREGDAAGSEVIAEYRRLVRLEIARARGHEMQTEGDGFFVVFDSAHLGLGCAMGIVRAAGAHTASRPERPIRVGIGIHSGEPLVQDGDYVGIAVNIAARLAQHAAPGEILVSDVVRGLLRAASLPPMRRREGIVLKGIEDPPAAYAVAAEADPAR